MQRCLNVCLILIMAMSVSAHAVLGERAPASTASRKVRQMAAVRSQQTLNYVTEDGPFGIKEYYQVAGGPVFAVSWRGQAHPDLSKLLGSYWPEVQQAFSSQRPPSRRPYNRYTTANVVVEKAGVMGNLSGRAYIPSMLPPGVDPEDFQ
jgi:hypothetical protein